MAKRMTEEQWRTVDELRRYWGAICDCDIVPIDTDEFKDRAERLGFIRWRIATKRDVADNIFAAELGIEVGGGLWELTAKGRKALEERPAVAV